MFLDEQLYICVKETQIITPKDIIPLLNNLFKICDDHIKNNLLSNDQATFKDIRILFDKVFNSWDLFVKRLEKEKFWIWDIFTNENSYKYQILKNSKVLEIYNKGHEKIS